MAVTVTAIRTSHTETVATTREIDTLTLTGTYVTGGFTLTPAAIPGNPGSSPLGGTFIWAQFMSPLGYIYVWAYSTTTKLLTVKIYSAANTELANGTTVPDGTVMVVIDKKKGA